MRLKDEKRETMNFYKNRRAGAASILASLLICHSSIGMEKPLSKDDALEWDIASLVSIPALKELQEKLENHLKTMQSLKEAVVLPDAVFEEELSQITLLKNFCTRRIRAMSTDDDSDPCLAANCEAAFMILDGSFLQLIEKREKQLATIKKSKVQLTKEPLAVSRDGRQRSGSQIVRGTAPKTAVSAKPSPASPQQAEGFFSMLINTITPPSTPASSPPVPQSAPKMQPRTGSFIGPQSTPAKNENVQK